jgi:hypothetical protein
MDQQTISIHFRLERKENRQELLAVANNHAVAEQRDGLFDVLGYQTRRGQSGQPPQSAQAQCPHLQL